MRRRTLLSGIGAAAGVGAGYGGYRLLRDPPTPGPATALAFASVDEQLAEPTDAPSVEFDESANRIVVSGTLHVGPADCNRASFDNVVYDDDGDALAVRVSWEERWSEHLRGCAAKDGVDSYRLAIDVDRFPEEFTAQERGYPNTRFETTKP